MADSEKSNEKEDQPVFLTVKNVVRRVRTRLHRARMPGRARFKQYVGEHRLLRNQSVQIDLDMAAMLVKDLAHKMESGIFRISLNDKVLSVDSFQELISEHIDGPVDVSEELVAVPEPGGLRPRESKLAQKAQEEKAEEDATALEASKAKEVAAKVAEEREKAEAEAKASAEAAKVAEKKAVEEAEAKKAAEEAEAKAEEAKARTTKSRAKRKVPHRRTRKKAAPKKTAEKKEE